MSRPKKKLHQQKNKVDKQLIQKKELEKYFYLEYQQYREHIFHELIKANPEFKGKKSLLVRLAQRFLNRCIFALYSVSTDRLHDFLIKNSLAEDYNPDGSDLWVRLQKLFDTAQNGQTSESELEFSSLKFPTKLFCTKNQGLSQKTLPADSKTLLYFSTNYNFSISDLTQEKSINPYILGRIFEKSLTELEILVAHAEGRPSLHESSGRKRNSVYYTPERVVACIVEETIGARLRELRIEAGLSTCDVDSPTSMDRLSNYSDALRQITILDPACGAGAFLVPALHLLLREHRWIATEMERINGGRETFDAAKTIGLILSENLYGVDINPDAVELTQFVLRLHAIKSEKSLHNACLNIQSGNTLVGPGFYGHSNSYGGFDCIIGNPPYVKLQNFRRVEPEMAAYLTDAKRADGTPLYASTQTGNFDLYLPFIEKGLALLKPTGRLGFIAPNAWVLSEYGRGLRELLLRNRSLECWVDFKDFQIFDDATTYTALQFFRGRACEEIKMYFAPDGDLAALKQSEVKPDTFPYAELHGKTVWYFLPDRERKLMERLQAEFPSLAESCDGITVGIQTSADWIYHLRKIGPRRYVQTRPDKSSAEAELEDEIMQPLVSGPTAKRYRTPETDTYLLFPYAVTDGRSKLIGEEVLRREFPNVWVYLKRHERELRGRENGKMDRDNGWWGYNYPKNLDKQKRAKLGVAQTVPSLRVFFDETGAFYFNNVRVNGILPRDSETGWFLLGILNAPLADFFFRRISKAKAGGFFEANKQFIAPLPIPNVTIAQKREVGGIAKKLQRLYTELQGMGHYAKKEGGDSQVDLGGHVGRLCGEIEECERNMNDVVCCLYGLTDEEIGLVGRTDLNF